jgi:hypothetical protein
LTRPASTLGRPYASWMIEAGVLLTVIQQHLGHKSIQTTIGVSAEGFRTRGVRRAKAALQSMASRPQSLARFFPTLFTHLRSLIALAWTIGNSIAGQTEIPSAICVVRQVSRARYKYPGRSRDYTSC